MNKLADLTPNQTKLLTFLCKKRIGVPSIANFFVWERAFESTRTYPCVQYWIRSSPNWFRYHDGLDEFRGCNLIFSLKQQININILTDTNEHIDELFAQLAPYENRTITDLQNEGISNNKILEILQLKFERECLCNPHGILQSCEHSKYPGHGNYCEHMNDMCTPITGKIELVEFKQLLLNIYEHVKLNYPWYINLYNVGTTNYMNLCDEKIAMINIQ